MLAYVLLGLFFLSTVWFTGGLIRGRLLLGLRAFLDVGMTNGFVSHMLSLPYVFFAHRPTGDLVMRVQSNSIVRELLTTSTLSTVVDGGLLMIHLAAVFVVSPLLGLVTSFLAALQLLVFVMVRRRQRELLAAELNQQSTAQSYQVELLTGVETVKAAGAETFVFDRWQGLFKGVLASSLERARFAVWTDAVNGTIRMAAPIILLCTAAWLSLAGNLTLGEMLAVAALAGGVLGPVASLAAVGTNLEQARSHLERIDDVMLAKPEQASARTRVGVLEGNISIEQLSFRYRADGPLALDDVTAHVTSGEFVAVVGRSGSGKSTLASLLLGLYAPESGRILFDGVDLQTLELSSLRQRLGIVTQKPHLFAATVRENIAFVNPGLTMDRIIEAARLACIHDDIEALPLGYDTLLQQGGASLSGGQRQRLAIARAIAHRPVILVLDEATNALDAVTEERVFGNLATLECTRIVVAHRLSSIASARRILLMHQGRLAEQGGHDQLMARRGLYSELVAAQLRS